MAKTTTKTTDEDEDQDKTADELDGDEDEDKTADDSAESGADEDEDDEDDDASILATLTPAQARLFKRVEAERAAASKQARDRRLALKALRSGAPAAGGPKPKAPTTKQEGEKDRTSAPVDFEAWKAEVLAEVKGTQEATKVDTAVEKALRRAGLILPEDEEAAERKLTKVKRMLDLSNVTLDEVADEVADLKAESPELFGRVRRPKPKTGGLGGPAKIIGAKTKNAAEELFD
jgi:hypothetical protein